MNSLLAPSTLPFALPDYAHLTDDDFRAAVLEGMKEQRAALEQIATDEEPPSVANTIEAWELSGQTLTRAMNAFYPAQAANTNDRRDEIMAELAPLMAAHEDAIWMDARLYERLVALRDSGTDFDAQDNYWLEDNLRTFERAGVNLDEDAKTRLREINAELAELSTQFTITAVAGRNAAAVLVTDEAELEGISDEEKAALKEAAEAAGKDGWLVELINTTQQPILAKLRNRELRRRIFEASVQRGLGGEHDTRQIVVKTMALRAEKAKLLGFEHYAAFVAADGCAKTTENVRSILDSLVAGIWVVAEREAVDLQARLDGEHPGATLEPWDWEYYAAKAAAEEAVDSEALMPYFEFNRVLHEGVFAAATAIYGITFHAREDLVGYTAESKVFEIREEDGTVLGALVVDPYTRSTKEGGAWMTSIVDHSQLTGLQPVVTNTCNFPKPAQGSPSLLTWDNVITLFHEFGHDLHGLLSDVRYPSRSGTSVPRDFVEYPSQVNEQWAFHPELLANYARHVETGEALPGEVVTKLSNARTLGIGFAKFETLAAQLLDQVWHTTPAEELPTSPEQVEEFEAKALAATGTDFHLIPPRYRTTYFNHIFANQYAAAYYAYLWSEVMDADTVAWFADNGGLSREAGEHFRRTLLAPGGSVDPMQTYRTFRGADPDIAHLLRRMGLEG